MVWSCSSDEHGTTPGGGVGPEGGTLELAGGATIELPPGAVPEGVKVTAAIVEAAAAPPSGLQVSGKVYAFLPHGTRFAKPVTIKIPASSATNAVFELDDDDDTSWEQVASSKEEKGFHAVTVEHISLFAELAALEGTGGAGGGGGLGAGGSPSTAGDGPGVEAGAGAGGAAQGGAGGAESGPPLVTRHLCAGYSHGCSIVDGGKISCWGAGYSGQLGDGMIYDDPEIPGRPSAALVPGIDNAVQISCGNDAVSALLDDGTVVGWGRGDSGQFGDATLTLQSAVPRPSSITHVKQLSASGTHVCALLEDKTVSCWGRSGFGQLGDGSSVETPVPLVIVSTPQAVPGLTNVLEVETGGQHTCVILADRTVKCFGDNQYGQLGVATPPLISTPVAVPGLTDVVHLTLGPNNTCALHGSGAVSCWGAGESGQLGDGEFREVDTINSTPVSVADTTNAQWVAMSLGHACLIDGAAHVRCWGFGGEGLLGDGVFYKVSPFGLAAPQPVSELDKVEDLTVGTDTTCVRLRDQSLWCWGYGVLGALGSGVDYPLPAQFPNPPTPIEALASAVPVRVISAP